jgi:polyisoprenoid-binding protein YceI
MRARCPLALLLALCLAPAGALAAKPRKSAAPPPPARPLLDVELFNLDVAHSSVEFSIQWMGLSRVRGTFTDFRGTVGYDSLDLTRSSVTVVAQAPSISTGNADRDKHLRSADFFDVEKFPTIVFKSAGIEKSGDGYRMRGTLELHGVTREVEVPFTSLGRVRNAGNATRIGFEGGFGLDRKDFGIVGPDRFNVMLEIGKRMMGEDVQIQLSVQASALDLDAVAGPTGDSLLRVVDAQGVAAMARQYRDARAQTPDSLMKVDEGVVSTLGYRLLRKGRAREAIQVFQLQSEAFPRSAFAYVGLGQAYAMNAEREAAVQSCEKAVAMNPAATRALEILRRLKTM